MSKPIVVCKGCGQRFHVSECVKVDSPNIRFMYLCHDCNRKILDYTTRNNIHRGLETKNNNTYGFEMETGRLNANDRRFWQFNWIPTHDITVALEWKSPIYHNLNGLAKMFRSFQKNGMVVDHTCGSHINIGNTNMTEHNFGVLASDYSDIFKPLYRAMKMNPDKTARLCGRDFTQTRGYASEFDVSHHNSFLTVRSNRIELRIAKFINPTQYMTCIKFTRDILNCINSNYLEHYSGMSAETREQKAKITSKKLVKLFNKYATISNFQ